MLWQVRPKKVALFRVDMFAERVGEAGLEQRGKHRERERDAMVCELRLHFYGTGTTILLYFQVQFTTIVVLQIVRIGVRTVSSRHRARHQPEGR